MFVSGVVEPRKEKLTSTAFDVGVFAPRPHAADRHQYICLGEMRGYTASGNHGRY